MAQKRQEKPLNSLFAGALAGAVEGFVTYPTEFVKVRLAPLHEPLLSSDVLTPHSSLLDSIAILSRSGCKASGPYSDCQEHTGFAWLSWSLRRLLVGVSSFVANAKGPADFCFLGSALVAGNAVKAGVRFLSYDSIKLAVADKSVSMNRRNTAD
jgi:solute carrier family 25 citrate transporter 1